MIHEKSLANRVSYQRNSGYWEVDNKYFFNKAECLRHATKTGNGNIKYHFFDEVFSESDWSIEPPQSLDQLYGERARQLRDKYDYILLSVSGGSDSMNMLYAFLNNGLHVDEVVTWYPVAAIEKLISTFNYDKKDPTNVMFEYVTAFMPQMKEVHKKYPNLKITILDHTDHALTVIGGANAHKFDMAGLTMGPGTAGPLSLVGYQRKLDIPNSAIIVGVDKPRLVLCPKTKRFGNFFLDFHSMWGGVSDAIYGGFHPTVEYFYFAWEFPNLIKKQSHVVKQAVQPLIEGEKGIDSPEYTKLLIPKRKNSPYDIFNVQLDFFEKLLYPTTHNPNVFQAAKPTSLLYAEANKWFTDSHLTDDKTKSFYTGQIDEFVAGIHSGYLYLNKQGRVGGFKPFNSPIKFF